MYLRVKLRERCAHTSFGLRRYLLFTISVVCASMHSISSIWFYISHNNHYCTLFRSISFRSLYLWSSTESIDSSGRRIFLPNYTLSVHGLVAHCFISFNVIIIFSHWLFVDGPSFRTYDVHQRWSYCVGVNTVVMWLSPLAWAMVMTGTKTWCRESPIHIPSL